MIQSDSCRTTLDESQQALGMEIKSQHIYVLSCYIESREGAYPNHQGKTQGSNSATLPLDKRGGQINLRGSE